MPIGNTSIPESVSRTLSQIQQQQQQLANISVPTSERERVASLAGRRVVPEASPVFDIAGIQVPGFLGILNELRRPQSAMFAGIRELRLGNGLSTAVKTFFDELSTGFLSGNLERDVQFSDVIDPINVTGRTKAQTAAGLVGDVLIDPLNVFAIRNALLIKPFRKASELARLGITKLDETQTGAKIFDKIERVLDSKLKFRMTPEELESTRIFRELERNLEGVQSVTREQAFETAEAIRDFSKEAGVEVNEVMDIISRKIQEVPLQIRAPGGIVEKSLEKRFNQWTRELGVDEFDTLTRELDDVLLHERPIREAVMLNDLQQSEKLLLSQVPEEHHRMLAEIITDTKDNMLRSFVYETNEAKKAYAALRGVPGKLGSQPFESAEIEYILFNATEEAQDVLLNTMFGDMVRTGLQWNPRHASQLHSELKKLGMTIQEINEQARLGQLELTLPSGQKFKVPKIEKFLDDDPIKLMAMRSYRAERQITMVNGLRKLTTNYGVQLTPKQLALTKGQRVLNELNDAKRALTKAELSTSGASPQQVGKLKKKVRDLTEQVNKVKGTTRFEEPLNTAQLSDEGIRLMSNELEGFRVLEDVPGFERMALPNEIGELVSRHWQKSTDPDFLNEVSRWFTDKQNIWKAWTLFPFAEYHFRNFIGNHWNMVLAGMGPAESYEYSFYAHKLMSLRAGTDRMRDRLIRKGAGIADKLPGRAANKFNDVAGTIKIAGEDVPMSQILDEAEEIGLLRSGFYGSGELPISLERTIEGGLDVRAKIRQTFTNLRVERNPVLRGGVDVAGAIEDGDRLALYLWARDQGLDVRDASQTAFKYLFDYNDLTPFEKRVFRNKLMPFYAWSRKNIPLQLEHLVQEPTKYTAVLKAKSSLESRIEAGEAPPELAVSKYIRDGFGVRFRQDPDSGNYEYFVLNNWWPAADLTELDSPEELKDFAINNSSPFIKTLFEQLTGENVFFDRPFLPERREFAVFRGPLALPERGIQLLKNIRVLSMVDRIARLADEPDLDTADFLTTFGRFLTGINTVEQDIQKGLAIRQGIKSEKEQELRGAIRRVGREIQRTGDVGRQREVERLLDELRTVLQER